MSDRENISDEDVEAFLDSRISATTDKDGEEIITFDPSDEQLHGWEETLAEIGAAQPDVIAVSTLSEMQLIDKYNEVKEELLERGEALSQKTQTGRDLQSERTALLVEMRRRGLR